MRSRYGISIVAGAIVGVVVLGWLGRLATAAVAVALDHPANLSVPGMLEATVVGAVGGATGGFLLATIRNSGVGAPLSGVATGAALFALTATLAWMRGRLPLGPTVPQAATLIVVFALYLAFGTVLDAVVERRVREDAADSG
jgi:hypothetical protein